MYQNENMFSKHKSERMPLWKLYDHAIDFMEDAKLPKLTKVYLLSLAERNSLDIWIDEELRKGYICPSTSPIAAPFFFVKKNTIEAYNPSWIIEPLTKLLSKIAIQSLE